MRCVLIYEEISLTHRFIFIIFLRKEKFVFVTGKSTLPILGRQILICSKRNFVISSNTPQKDVSVLLKHARLLILILNAEQTLFFLPRKGASSIKQTVSVVNLLFLENVEPISRSDVQSAWMAKSSNTRGIQRFCLWFHRSFPLQVLEEQRTTDDPVLWVSTQLKVFFYFRFLARSNWLLPGEWASSPKAQ